jgi:hypothetical protein
VAQIVTQWRIRAVHQGYVQLIDEGTLVPVKFLRGLGDGTEMDGDSLVADKGDADGFESRLLQKLYAS